MVKVYDPIMNMLADEKVTTKDAKKENVEYRELYSQVREIQSEDVKVFVKKNSNNIIEGFTVSWDSSKEASSDQAVKFSNYMSKAAKGAKELERKYKGFELIY